MANARAVVAVDVVGPDFLVRDIWFFGAQIVDVYGAGVVDGGV